MFLLLFFTINQYFKGSLMIFSNSIIIQKKRTACNKNDIKFIISNQKLLEMKINKRGIHGKNSLPCACECVLFERAITLMNYF